MISLGIDIAPLDEQSRMLPVGFQTRPTGSGRNPSDASMNGSSPPSASPISLYTTGIRPTSIGPYAYTHILHEITSHISLRLLPGIRYWVILSKPNLRPTLCCHMFHKRLTGVFGSKLADPAGVPELASHAKIFTAAHHGVGFAALCCGGDAVGGEIVLFAARDGDEAVEIR